MRLTHGAAARRRRRGAVCVWAWRHRPIPDTCAGVLVLSGQRRSWGVGRPGFPACVPVLAILGSGVRRNDGQVRRAGPTAILAGLGWRSILWRRYGGHSRGTGVAAVFCEIRLALTRQCGACPALAGAGARAVYPLPTRGSDCPQELANRHMALRARPLGEYGSIYPLPYARQGAAQRHVRAAGAATKGI